jgi:hypothetical protein
VAINKINGVQDMYEINDSLSKQVSRVSLITKFRPTYEEFTSSTCFPCANFHKKFTPWCEDHADDITLIKYQMNWPGLGDPYYTLEGGQRKDYYQCSYVPDLYHGGYQSECNMTNVNANFAADMQKRGRMKIMATHTLDFHTIHVKATVLPFDDFSNPKVHIVVMERETHNNARNNGETVFEHVMMKMMPNANGTTVNLTDRVPVTIIDSVDLTGTHVEEWDDLIVGVFVQNFGSREVYQSTYTIENGSPANNADLAGIFIDGQPLQGFTPGQFNYTVVLPAGTTAIPVVTATLADTNATMVLIPAYSLPGAATIDVFGEDLISHNLYTVEFVVPGVGVVHTADSQLRIFPNPIGEKIFFSNPVSGRIKLYSSLGQIVVQDEHFSGDCFVPGKLAAGIYVIVIEQPGKAPVIRKLTVCD